MKYLPILSLGALLALSSCSYFFSDGAVEQATIDEFISCKHVYVTSALPSWLLEEVPAWALAKEPAGELNKAQLTELKQILESSRRRRVPERYYRSAEEGNRGDDSTMLFYLSAENSQSLGGRVMPGKRVLLDDFTVSEENQLRLYTLLEPQLQRLFPALKK